MRARRALVILPAMAAGLLSLSTQAQDRATVNVRADDRPYGVLRIIDSETRGERPLATNAAALGRARAEGELPPTEGVSGGIVDKVITIERYQSGAVARPRTSGLTPAIQPAVEGAIPAGVKPATGFDDVARSREHARYEREKKQRMTEAAARAKAEAQARAPEEPRAVTSDPAADSVWLANHQAGMRAAERPMDDQVRAFMNGDAGSPAYGVADYR